MVLRRLAQLELLIASLLLGAIVVLVFAAAVMRFFGHPLIWSIDLAQLMFVWLCFFGAARAMRSKSHIGIDLLVRWLPHRHRLTLELAIGAIIIVFLLLLAREGYGLAMQNWQRQFGDSGLSYAWVTMAVPVGCLMLVVALCSNMIKALRRRGDGQTLVYSRTDSEFVAPTEL
jgi:TRAP-type C4-dicarboxylate transport system permease small subunit